MRPARSSAKIFLDLAVTLSLIFDLEIIFINGHFHADHLSEVSLIYRYPPFLRCRYTIRQQKTVAARRFNAIPSSGVISVAMTSVVAIVDATMIAPESKQQYIGFNQSHCAYHLFRADIRPTLET